MLSLLLIYFLAVIIFFTNPFVELVGVSIILSKEIKFPFVGLIYEFKVLSVRLFFKLKLTLSPDEFKILEDTVDLSVIL